MGYTSPLSDESFLTTSSASDHSRPLYATQVRWPPKGRQARRSLRKEKASHQLTPLSVFRPPITTDVDSGGCLYEHGGRTSMHIPGQAVDAAPTRPASFANQRCCGLPKGFDLVSSLFFHIGVGRDIHGDMTSLGLCPV